MPEQYAATLLSIKDAFIHMQSILAESNLCVIGYDYITQTQDSQYFTNIYFDNCWNSRNNTLLKKEIKDDYANTSDLTSQKKIILDINTDMYHLEPRVLCQQQKDTTDFDVK